MYKLNTLIFILQVGSCGSVEIKVLALGARGQGLHSMSSHKDFRDWLSPACKSQYTYILKTK